LCPGRGGENESGKWRNGEMGNEGGSKDDDEPDDDGFEDGETPKATPSRRRRHFGHDDDDNDGPAGATNRCILTWAWAWQWANGKVPCLNTLKGAPESQVHKEATPSSIPSQKHLDKPDKQRYLAIVKSHVCGMGARMWGKMV